MTESVAPFSESAWPGRLASATVLGCLSLVAGVIVRMGARSLATSRYNSFSASEYDRYVDYSHWLVAFGILVLVVCIHHFIRGADEGARGTGNVER